jgi:signal transduction histidine kinase
LRDADGHLSGAICVSTDISERRRVEREVLAATERERRRIGRDLHDSIQGSLAGVRMLLTALHQMLQRQGHTAAGDVRNLRDIVTQTIEQIRGLSRSLCPLDLEAEGLMAALEQLASTMSSLFHVRCEFCCPVPVLVNDQNIALQLYYICQEAVTNAIKHGRLASIKICLAGQGDRLWLEVSDDGVGLPADAGDGQGMGLRTMRYRARMIGAELDILRGQTRGTDVSCRLQSPAIEADVVPLAQ